jgi:type II secretory pathway predicted ATPase ExeA
MYHAHFGLNEEPFGVAPDSRFYYETDQHREALATLYYAIEQRRGFALLIGRAGLGKTSILVNLSQLLKGKAEIAFLPIPCLDPSAVLDAILLSLGLPTQSSLAQDHRTFYEYLMKLRLAGKTCVVLFDEAQGFNRDTLEAIRMLSNFETESEKLVQIVLCGQPQLAETISQPGCEQLRQRLNVVARLEPLGSAEIGEYIVHRLKTAGGSGALFDREAVKAITEAAGGVLRNVNTICFNALTIAYALGHSSVGVGEVAEALRDLDVFARLTHNDPPQTISLARAIIPSWSIRIRLPAQSLRPAIIAASLVLVTAGTLLARSLLLALR